MSRACCAGGCSSYASKKDDGVSFHYFPRDSMLRTEWIRRVSHGRKNWTYWKSSRLCSRHFTPDSFFTGFHCHKHLKPDSVPTLFCTDVSEVEVAVEEPSSRKRHAGDDINWLDEWHPAISEPSQNLVPLAADLIEHVPDMLYEATPEAMNLPKFAADKSGGGWNSPPNINSSWCCCNSPNAILLHDTFAVNVDPDFYDLMSQTASPNNLPSVLCACPLINVDSMIKIETVYATIQTQTEVAVHDKTGQTKISDVFTQTDGSYSDMATQTDFERQAIVADNVSSCDNAGSLCNVDYDDDNDDEDDSDNNNAADDDPDWTDADDCATGSTNSFEELLNSDCSSPINERKFIVFESCLHQLLLVCLVCLGPCRIVIHRVVGSCIMLQQQCANGHHRDWSSQPSHGMIPLGNMLIAASILFTGSNPTKVLNVFRHLQVPMIAIRTYNLIQSCYLVPAVKRVWFVHQQLLINSLKGKACSLGGDARCCTPGHNAKYSSYALMELSLSKIVDVKLVQVTEVNNSNAMELEGLKRCLNRVLHLLNVNSITTDRHPSVNKYLCDEHPSINHYFDIWHIAKSIKKKIDAMSKRRDCAILNEWSQAISNHLYWCVASSGGDSALVLAKWWSILRHIIDIHSGHGEPFNNCLHGTLEPRLWLTAGSKAHKELELIVRNKLLCRDIKKLAPTEQTSSVESYHRVVILFAPKNVHFIHSVMEARILLATLHFNENSNRAQVLTKQGKPRWTVSFPKPKKGYPVVKPVKVPITFGYVNLLMNEVMSVRDHLPTYAKAKESLQFGANPKPSVAASFVKHNKDTLVLAHRSRFCKVGHVVSELEM